ncbi:MAG: hypothetical protein U9Q70_11630 [Chloroflexota bacterium]|nr:hypothetical protein [Chloroflexota bacterium]
MASYLQKYGIVKNPGKASTVFETLFPDIYAIDYDKPSHYIEHCWQKYSGQEIQGKVLNGLIFEYILATLLIREELLPFYLQAQVAFVPNIQYDLLLYTAKYGPICLSAKTSLRERYKQADLEAIALKYVHRRTKNYLITMNEQEGLSIQTKIEEGKLIGLDEVIVATTNSFDELIIKLKDYTFSEAPTIEVVKTGLIVTAAKIGNKT